MSPLRALQDSTESNNETRSCERIFDSLRELAASQGHPESRKSIVYQCRSVHGGRSDDCGGFGDRLAGLFSAAFLALASGRAFYIDWTDLNDVFSSNVIDWSYNPTALLSPPDLKVVGLTQITTATKQMGNATSGFTFVPVEGLSEDVAFANALNLVKSVHFREPWMTSAMEPHNVVLFHSNRGLSEQWVKDVSASHPAWPPLPSTKGKGHYPQWLRMYPCLFEGLFGNVPPPGLLESTYRHLQGDGETVSEVPFRRVWAEASQGDTVAVHWRQNDHLARLDQVEATLPGKPKRSGEDQTCPLPQPTLEDLELLARNRCPGKYGGGAAVAKGESEAAAAAPPPPPPEAPAAEAAEAAGTGGRGGGEEATSEATAERATKACVLVLSTNSLVSAKQVAKHFGQNRTNAFDHVFVQALEGEIHTNPKEFRVKAADDEAFQKQHEDALKQTMRDWWLMQSSDVIVQGSYGPPSGFSSSAAMVSKKPQLSYQVSGQKFRPGKNHGCALSGGNLNPPAAAPPTSLNRIPLCAQRFCRKRHRKRKRT